MSTRSWYEYYVVDESTRELSLAMQFYRWAHAEPDVAVAEVDHFTSLTARLNHEPPVELVRNMLQDNLGSAFSLLRASFPLGCYYFLLTRAREELSTFALWRNDAGGLPEEERPDYRLGFAVGHAEGMRGCRIPSFDDPVIDRAHFSISVGMFVRRWLTCSARMSFLRWIQLITLTAEKPDMGSIAGDYRKPMDISYVYRVFFHVPAIVAEGQRVDRIRLELCDASGKGLLQHLAQESERARGDECEWLKEQYRDVPCAVEQLQEGPTALDSLLRTYTLVPSPFWDLRLPRNEYLGP